MKDISLMTVEQLEKDYWGNPPENSSHLIRTCYRLRQVPVIELDIEGLRILIRQNIGLKYLIPLAIKILKENPFSEGDLFEGDLLLSVLSSDKVFWKNDPETFKEMLHLIMDIEEEIKNLDSTEEIKEKLTAQLTDFKNNL